MDPIAIQLLIGIASILIPITGMFLWNRAEANADRRDMQQKLEAYMRETRDKIDVNMRETRDKIDVNMHETREQLKSNMHHTRAMIEAIQLEIKDFHARLCVIEASRKT